MSAPHPLPHPLPLPPPPGQCYPSPYRLPPYHHPLSPSSLGSCWPSLPSLPPSLPPQGQDSTLALKRFDVFLISNGRLANILCIGTYFCRLIHQVPLIESVVLPYLPHKTHAHWPGQWPSALVLVYWCFGQFQWRIYSRNFLWDFGEEL